MVFWKEKKALIKKLIYAIPVVIFLYFVFYIMGMTYKKAKPIQKAIQETQFNFKSYVALSKKFEGLLQQDIFNQFNFINLNGAMAKTLGFNSLNNVQKLANGYLTRFANAKDITDPSRNIAELNTFLSERGIPFLYILVPSKTTMYDVKFAPGYDDESRKNLNNMVNAQKEAGVHILDMESWFRKKQWHMEDVFFKTDHHWMPQVGLVAAQQTMTWLQQQHLAIPDAEKLQEDSYTIQILKRSFLGSHGKRTGKGYAGLDDISVYYPKFKTNFLYSGLNANSTTWNDSEDLLRKELIKEKNYKADQHCIYLYGDYPLQIISNMDAINKKRVFITGDSFRRVWQYFLATQFQQIYSMDLRHYTDGTFAQYIEEIKPDIVIMLINTNSLSNMQLFNFGIDEYNRALAETKADEPKIALGDFEIASQDKNNNNFVLVGNNLKAGQAYTLTVDNADVLKGKTNHIQITLQNLITNKAVVNHYFETGTNHKQKWLFTVPNDSDVYALYLYSGTKDHAAGISVKVTNLLLQKGFHENRS